MMNQDQFFIDIDDMLNIYELKKEIYKKKKYSPDDIKLIFYGNILENNKKISEYKIQNENCIIALIQKKIIEEKKNNEDDIDEHTDSIDLQNNLPNVFEDIVNIFSNFQGVTNNNNVIPEILQNFTNILQMNTEVININQLTDEEKEDVNTLQSLGVSFVEAYQYYMSCNKDKNMAANLITDILEN